MTSSAALPPKSIEELHVRRSTLEDLALKTLYLLGEISLHELVRHMGVSLTIVEELFQRLLKEQLCQVTGMDRGVHRITTTSGGKTRALELLAQNQYAGPAPVSLQDYVDKVNTQSVRTIEVTPKALGHVFEDVVLETETLAQLGTAVVSGRALFLYGPTGTGKTLIATTLTRLFEHDRVWIPHALEVDGQIITVYDPVLHKTIDQPRGNNHDRRWVLCQRPRVMVGGELTIDMLDLQFNHSTKFYTGPVQMKANNGLLIIDDFGRQRVSPEELLNRWVVPLDRRIDFLTLAGGTKIEIPFDLFVVFATNLDPAKMVDEAFLRRIQTKIKVDFVSSQNFEEIFRRACSKLTIVCNGTSGEDLVALVETDYNEPLRACYPRDILQQIIWEAKYLQKTPIVDYESMARACKNYFLAK